MLPEDPPPDPIPEDISQLREPPELRTVLPPAPLPQAMAERYKGNYWPPRRILRSHLFGHGVVFYLFALSMMVQPDRYTTGNLPSLTYALGYVPIHMWAVLFGIVATFKMFAFWKYPTLSRVAVVAGMTLVCFLTLLFVMAWIWGPASVFLLGFASLDIGGHVFAICHIDGRRRWREPST